MALVLDTRQIEAFTAVAPTANIYEIQTARHGIAFQERSQPVEITLGDEAGIRANIHNGSTVGVNLRTIFDLFKPDGSVGDSVSWEEGYSANEYKWYEKWFTLDTAGLWQVMITVEFPTAVGALPLDTATVGVRAAGGEVEGFWPPSLTTIGVATVISLSALGLLLLAKRKNRG